MQPTASAAMSRTLTRVTAVILGFLAMRVTRSRMLLTLPVMVVAVSSRAEGRRDPAAIMPTSVRP